MRSKLSSKSVSGTGTPSTYSLPPTLWALAGCLGFAGGMGRLSEWVGIGDCWLRGEVSAASVFHMPREEPQMWPQGAEG